MTPLEPSVSVVIHHAFAGPDVITHLQEMVRDELLELDRLKAQARIEAAAKAEAEVEAAFLARRGVGAPAPAPAAQPVKVKPGKAPSNVIDLKPQLAKTQSERNAESWVVRRQGAGAQAWKQIAKKSFGGQNGNLHAILGTAQTGSVADAREAQVEAAEMIRNADWDVDHDLISVVAAWGGQFRSLKAKASNRRSHRQG